MSDLIPFLENVTPEHAFMFMLLDRVNQLEDEQETYKEKIELLQKDIPKWIPYEWYMFRFTKKIETDNTTDGPVDIDLLSYSYTTLREYCINLVFKNRIVTNPQFSFWKWMVKSNNVWELIVYVRFSLPISLKNFDHIQQEIGTLTNDSPYRHRCQIIPMHGGMSDMKMLLTEYLGYIDRFPCTDAGYGMDIWRKGGDEIEYPLETKWTNGDFLSSPNYRKTVSEMISLRNNLLGSIKIQNWLDLFHIGDYDDE